MEIRYYTELDNKIEISRIYEESWKYAYRGIVPQAYLDAIPEGHWVNNLDIPGWNTMVCVENGTYIGTSSFCKSRWKQYPDAGEIISIYFLPDYIGKGYGRQLLNAVLGELKKQGFSEVFLWVLEENLHARHFYESFGFSRTDDRMSGMIGGKELWEIRYVCHI